MVNPLPPEKKGEKKKNKKMKASDAYGMFSDSKMSVDDFFREKHEDNEREEEKYRERFKNRGKLNL